MTDAYESFTAVVNDALVARGEKPLEDADQSTIVHAFGYGKDAEETVYNIRAGRAARRWLVDSILDSKAK